MQYAEVVLRTKTSLDRQSFVYQIKPEQLPYIQPGILVLVPFRKQNIEGIVISLKPYRINVLKSKLKTIIRIIDRQPILNKKQINLAKKISNYYLSSMGEAIFTMIPPVARRLSSNMPYNYPFEAKNKFGGTYAIYDRIENRIIKYIEMIKKTIAGNHGAILLFPRIDNIYLNTFSRHIPDSKIAVIHGNLKNSERYKIFKEIISGEKNIIIGSRSAIFSPVKNLKLVIIDEPENFAYKEDQSPKYHTVDVAKIIQNINNINLILGSSAPRIEDYKKILDKKIKVIKNNHKKITENIKCSIINQNTQKSIISYTLENKITEYSKNKQKILIYVSKKGEGYGYICSDCGYTFLCQRCNLPLYLQQNKLRCFKCATRIDIPSTCPNCQGIKLKSYGVGTEKIKKELLRLFPNLNINIVEDDLPFNDSIYRKSDIIVATKKIFISHYVFFATAIIGIDNLFCLPDYKAEENILFDLLNLMNITHKEIVIQTFYPDNFVIQNISRPTKILSQILKERKKFNFPPFYKIIRLLYSYKNETQGQKETEKMIHELKKNKFHDLEIIGSGPCFISKKRDKFRFQVILKYPPAVDKQLKTQLMKIKNLSKWSVDADPITLL